MPLDNLQDKFDALVKEVKASRSLADLNEKETIILGRKGVVNQWLKELLKTEHINKKKQLGKQINQYKNQLIGVFSRLISMPNRASLYFSGLEQKCQTPIFQITYWHFLQIPLVKAASSLLLNL